MAPRPTHVHTRDSAGARPTTELHANAALGALGLGLRRSGRWLMRWEVGGPRVYRNTLRGCSQGRRGLMLRSHRVERASPAPSPALRWARIAADARAHA